MCAMLSSARWNRDVIATLAIVLLAAISIQAQQNTLCENGESLGVGCEQALDLQPQGQQMLDQQVLGQDIPTAPLAYGEAGFIIKSKADEDAHTALKSGTNLAAASTVTQTDTQTATTAPSEVSNWLFVVPVALALVSLGLAVRARVLTRRRGFQKLQDSSHVSEDINPFCGDNCAFDVEDSDLETPGHFQGESSSEEEQVLEEVEMENDDGELVESEEMAVQQALMVHIEQTSSDDEEVEI